MAKPSMPLIWRHFDMKKSLFEGLNVRELDGIKANLTFARQKNLPRGYVLYEKMIRMKFKKDMIITCQFMNGKKMFGNFRNMKDIL
jgi:hypothetical protein